MLDSVGLSKHQVEEMYRYLAIANYEDRFVIPTAHREEALNDAFAERGGWLLPLAMNTTVTAITVYLATKPVAVTWLTPCKLGRTDMVTLPNGWKATNIDKPIFRATAMIWKLLKVIGLLMDYPSHELFADDTLDVCKDLVKIHAWLAQQCEAKSQTIDNLTNLGELEAQARYDSLFERGRTLSLWLFEHVHGESRDRGQAMVDLMAQYEQAGFAIDAKELPDYIPMYLEFWHTKP